MAQRVSRSRYLGRDTAAQNNAPRSEPGLMKKGMGDEHGDCFHAARVAQMYCPRNRPAGPGFPT